jgi:hypothetical protein
VQAGAAQGVALSQTGLQVQHSQTRCSTHRQVGCNTINMVLHSLFRVNAHKQVQLKVQPQTWLALLIKTGCSRLQPSYKHGAATLSKQGWPHASRGAACAALIGLSAALSTGCSTRQAGVQQVHAIKQECSTHSSSVGTTAKQGATCAALSKQGCSLPNQRVQHS